MNDERHIPCGACGVDQPQLVSFPLVPDQAKAVTPGWEEIRVVRCMQCGFYYVDPMPLWNHDVIENV